MGIKAFIPLLSVFLFFSPLSEAADQTSGTISHVLEQDRSESAPYHYGWLGILGLSSSVNGYKAMDAEEYSYREAYSLLTIRPLFVVFKFLTKPVATLDAYDRYKEIEGNKKLNENQKHQAIQSLVRQVSEDQKVRKSLKKIVIGTIVNTLVTARIYQMTEDQQLATQAFVSGLLMQIVLNWTTPSNTSEWLESSKHQWSLSITPEIEGERYWLGWSYRFD